MVFVSQSGYSRYTNTLHKLVLARIGIGQGIFHPGRHQGRLNARRVHQVGQQTPYPGQPARLLAGLDLQPAPGFQAQTGHNSSKGASQR